MTQPLLLTDRDIFNLEKKLCERSLIEFVKQAWHVIEPGQPYVHGWHLDVVAAHLEAVSDGDINRLLINIPPGTMKSLIVSVFWPAWEWGPRDMQYLRVIGASHEEGLAIRDSLRMRRLITSEWYQQRWPVELAGDQNLKTNFENTKTGWRQSCPVKSMTGKRGDRVIWDDPHNVEGALSDADRETTIRVLKETLPTRVNNPEKSAIVIVMQRLHERDVSGVILEEKLGYVHLCLPMEFEPERRCRTLIDFEDPRTEEGELLFPARFPRHVVDRDKKAMGSMAVAGQFQQRPAPRGGGAIEADMLQISHPPARFVKVLRYWDKAGTEGAGKFTAGCKMGLDEQGRFWILDITKGQWGAPKRERNIKQTAQADGIDVDIWIEQEPGSGGKESAENTIKNLAGHTCKADRVTGDKEVRAEPFAVQVAAGNVFLAPGDWNKPFIEECRTFPVGQFKDQVDSASGAFNKLALANGVHVYGGQFDSNTHVAVTGLWPKPKVPVFIGWHLAQTPACIFAQVIDGQVRILQEEVADGMGVRQFAQSIAKIIRNKYLNSPKLSVGSQRIVSPTPTDERSCADIIEQELGQYGIDIDPADVDDTTGLIESVRNFLGKKTAKGEPALVIDPGCRVLIKGFEGGYRYALRTSGDDKKMSPEPEDNEFARPHNALQFLLAEVLYRQSK